MLELWLVRSLGRRIRGVSAEVCEVDVIAGRVRFAHRVFQYLFLVCLLMAGAYLLRSAVPEAEIPNPDPERKPIGPFTAMGTLAAGVIAGVALFRFRFSNQAWFFGSFTLPLVFAAILLGLSADARVKPDDDPWKMILFGGVLAAVALWFRWPRMTGLRKLYRGVGALEPGEFERKITAAERCRSRLMSHSASGLPLRRVFALALQITGVAGIVAFLLLSQVKGAFEAQGYSQEQAFLWIERTLPGGEQLISIMLVGGMAAYLAGRMLSYREGRPLIEGGAPIAALFLRSFSDDSEKVSSTLLLWKILTLGIVGRVRVEEALAQDLEPLGAFVGIGQPGERLPKLGAARIYAADDEWQDLVRNLMERAGVVLMMAGASHWVAWEAAGLRESGKLGRTLIVLPQRTVARRREALDNLASAAPELAPIAALPDEALETVRAVHVPHPGAAPRLYRARERTDMTYRVIQLLFFADLEQAAQAESGVLR